MKDWNYERKRTRDRLIEYDPEIMPPVPHSGGIMIPSIYPWENITQAMLEQQLYVIAQANGYTDTKDAFFARFGNESSIIVGALPAQGNEHTIYFNSTDGILYHCQALPSSIDQQAIEDIGGVIVDQSLYIPVSAMPIADTILNCGDAAEYID